MISISALSVLGFLIATGLFEPLEAGALVPGFVGVFVVGVGLLEAGVGLAGVVFDGVGLEGVVLDGVGVGLDCVFEAAELDAVVLGLGLDKGVLAVVGFVAVVDVLDMPVGEDAWAFLVALAALSLLVLVGLGLSVLGTGDGLVKGVVLVDSGVLALVGVLVVPAVAGLVLGVVLAGAELGFAVCGLDIGVLVAAEGVVVGLAEAGRAVGRAAADVGLDTPFVCGFVVVPGLLAFALGADLAVVFGAVVFGLAGGTDRLGADAWPPAVPAFATVVFGVDAVGRGLGFAADFVASDFFKDEVGALALDDLDALPGVFVAFVVFGAGFDGVFFSGAGLAFDSETSSVFFASSTGTAIGIGTIFGSCLASAVSELKSSVVSICWAVFAFNS